MANECIMLMIMNNYHNLKMVELTNWDGVAYIGKRKHIPLLQKIEQLNNPAIYFLLGQDNETDEKVLYIGETENAANRFQSHIHDKDKDWFEDFIVFTSKYGDLNKAHVRYLEAEFIELAQNNLTTIKLDNGCNSKNKKEEKIKSFDLAKAEGFKEKILFILNHLNLIDFLNTGETYHEISSNNLSSEIFRMNLKKINKDKEAHLAIVDNGYKLLKGSCTEKEIVPSFVGMSAYKKREELIQKGLLQDNGSYYVTTEDIYFKSPSGASDIVAGSSTNGRVVWKLANGTTLNDYEQK